MKVILVVTSGVHTGKEIPFPGPQFLIGRDEGCHLRPASPAISKKHCSFVVREQKVFVKDLGSTNGTLVNDVAITDETELNPGDRIKVGPLDFTLKVASTGSKTDQAKPSSEAMKPTTQVKQTASGGMLKSASQPIPAGSKPVPVPKPAAASSDDPDKIAAMLLSMDDDDTSAPPSVPEGSTVMEMPAVDATGKPVEKKKEIPTQPDSSAIARDLLSKMSRRPR